MPKEYVAYRVDAIEGCLEKGVLLLGCVKRIFGTFLKECMEPMLRDFDPAMRSAMNISILFRSKYEGDLRATVRMLGTEMSAVIPRLPVGYSIFHLADVGDPFVLAWRPTYSQP